MTSIVFYLPFLWFFFIAFFISRLSPHPSPLRCLPSPFTPLYLQLSLFLPPGLLFDTPSALRSLSYPLKLMEHITGLLKIGPPQSQFIFFFPSFFLSLPLMLLFFLFSVPPSGGKWVTARGLVSSFISWQPMCSYRGRAAEAVGPRGPFDRAPLCLSVTVCHTSWLYGHGALARSGNDWAVSVYEGCRNGGHHLLVGPGGLKSLGKAGGRLCARRIYQEQRMDEAQWRRKASGRCMSK